MANPKYERLRNTELPDASADWAPVITAVYENPITRAGNEGVAILREPDLSRCDDEWWDGRVEFVEELGQYYSRRIWRKATPCGPNMGIVNGLPPGERLLED